MDSLRQDLRYAFRTLGKNPGFAAVAVLALGIGANTAIFSVENAVLLRPLPFPDPDRLTMVYSVNPAKGFPRFPASASDFVDWRGQSRLFEGMATVDGAPYNLSEGAEPERLAGSRVSASFLRVVGIKPALGRDFLPDDDREGAEPVVLIGHGLWTWRLGARRTDVLIMVLRQGLRLVLAGAALGVAATFGLTRLMSSLLFGVSPTDPATLGAACVLLVGVALLACFVPARRASGVDPMIALRCE